MILRFAFWNVENLFHFTANHLRATGPKSPEEYSAKLKAVARVIRRMFARHIPDLLGIAEVGNAAVFQDLLDEFSDRYAPIWVDSARETDAGLGFAYRKDIFSAREVAVFPTRKEIRDIRDRPHCLVIELVERDSGLAFLVVVNHWKSNVGVQDRNINDRAKTARQLGDLLLDQSTRASGRDRPVILMGDFNADPFDGIFDQQRLRGHRSFSTIRSWRSSAAEFYNPCWRFLPHQAFYPDAVRAGFLEDRPQTSLAGSTIGIFDQMLFSKSLMIHPRIIFRDKDVRLFYDGRNSRHVRTGRRIPWRWSENWIPGGGGVSDHFPICAKLTIR